MKKIAVVLTLAVAFCFIMVPLAHAQSPPDWAKLNLKNKLRAAAIPIWQLTTGEISTCCAPSPTSLSVLWGGRTRFTSLSFGTTTQEDDIVLDTETGLVWERSPSTTITDWNNGIHDAYGKYLGRRKGWRLPTVEELASLVDPSKSPSLPTGHPFINVQAGLYWTSTTYPFGTGAAYCVNFNDGDVAGADKSSYVYVWCVRGGQGGFH